MYCGGWSAAQGGNPGQDGKWRAPRDLGWVARSLCICAPLLPAPNTQQQNPVHRRTCVHAIIMPGAGKARPTVFLRRCLGGGGAVVVLAGRLLPFAMLLMAHGMCTTTSSISNRVCRLLSFLPTLKCSLVTSPSTATRWARRRQGGYCGAFLEHISSLPHMSGPDECRLWCHLEAVGGLYYTPSAALRARMRAPTFFGAGAMVDFFLSSQAFAPMSRHTALRALKHCYLVALSPCQCMKNNW